MQWGVPKILAAARFMIIPAMWIQRSGSISVGQSQYGSGRLRGRDKLILGMSKEGGEIYDRAVQVKYEPTPKDGQSSFIGNVAFQSDCPLNH